MITVNREGFLYGMFPINCVPQHDSLYEKISHTRGKQYQVKLILGMVFAPRLAQSQNSLTDNQ
ncbi:MAG: hypothetical protein GX797_01140 [Chloroflexi bacterium]|jgi:hypothetical protein|nr:hypothetical protein [Chloroflexota bacterium]